MDTESLIGCRRVEQHIINDENIKYITCSDPTEAGEMDNAQPLKCTDVLDVLASWNI